MGDLSLFDERPTYDELVQQVAELRDKMDRQLRVGDLPIEELKRRLEADLLPDGDTFLLPHTVGHDSLEQPELKLVSVFTNGWVNFGGAFLDAGYYKDAFGFVHLRGIIKSGTIGAVAFTLDAGYRPQGTSNFSAAGSIVVGVCQITAAGTVNPANGNTSDFSLEGIIFKAA